MIQLPEHTCHFRQTRISKPKACSPHKILTRDLRRNVHVAEQQMGCTKWLQRTLDVWPTARLQGIGTPI